jgi:hypothetical protein
LDKEDAVLSLTQIIRVLGGLLTLFGMFNWLAIMLSDQIRHYIPIRLTPITSYMDAIIVFGVGSVVYLLATMAAGGKKAGGH